MRARKTTQFVRLLTAVAALAIGSQALASGYVYESDSSKDLWGFEIGNGWKLVYNADGKYRFRVPSQWEVNFPEAARDQKVTEVFGPSSEGDTRTRINVDLLSEPTIVSFDELTKAMREARLDNQTLNEVRIADFRGFEIVTEDNGIRQVKEKLFQSSGSVIQITFDGKPGTKEKPTSFDRVKEAFQTLKVSRESDTTN